MTKPYRDYIKSLVPQGRLPMLGAKASIEALSERIYSRLTEDPQSQDPLVVGLYGEWGAGKTFWLKWIRSEVMKVHKPDKDSAQIIPVFFNAWRFEKEEHLIIPLLKSTATSVQKFAEFDDGKLGERFKAAGKQLALSVAAVSYNLAKKIDEDVLKSYVIGTLNESQKTKQSLDERFRGKLERVQEATSELESLYFDFHENMQSILQGDGKRPIRLLFLIDDLDRCLPEKAVEMLESIKLFLEMPGTAFVLAVDDEVVERGIAHRYQAYKESGELNNSPISGHEYLEKMIILPVRIDRAAETLVDEFIESRCKPLSKLRIELAAQDKPELDEVDQTAAKAKGKGKRDPFEDILRVVPGVPRKLLRLSELFDHRKQVLEQKDDESGQDQALGLNKQLALLRLLALQLFSPEIYRLAQRTGKYNIYNRLNEIKNISAFENLWPNYKEIQKQLEALNSQEDKSPTNRRDRELLLIPLLKALAEAQQHRAGFDPGSFLDHWNPELTEYEWARLFGHPAKARDLQEPAQVNFQHELELNDGALTDLLRKLVTASASGWREAIHELPPGQLKSADAQQLVDKLKIESESFDDEMKREWVQTNGIILSPETLLESAKALRFNDDELFANNEFNLDTLKTYFNELENPAEKRLLAGDLIGFLSPEEGIRRTT